MENNSSPFPQRKPFWTNERYYQIGVLILTIGIFAAIIMYRDQIVDLKGYGYLGIFLISILSSSSIVIPVPGLLLVAAMGAVLNPLLVGIISAVGGTLGEMTGYALGYGGRIAVDQSAIYNKMVLWMKRWGSFMIFGLAIIPNPLFDIAGLVAGTLRFPLWKFLLFGAAGRIPKHILIAYFGAWGISVLPF